MKNQATKPTVKPTGTSFRPTAPGSAVDLGGGRRVAVQAGQGEVLVALIAPDRTRTLRLRTDAAKALGELLKDFSK